MRNIKFGVEIPTFAGVGGTHRDCPFYEKIDWELVKKTALNCERWGYDNVWTPDHFILGKDGEIFEIWTILSALSSITRKIGLGALCICNSYRNPAVLAKMAATFDVISGGRLILGMGCGWYEQEYRAYGIPFPKPIVRIRQMKEGIKVIKNMWTQDKPSYKGKYYSIENATCEPKPVQKPHPPIIVGAVQPLMLKAVAEVGDGWNIGDDPTIEVYKEKLGILKKWCSEVGRDPKEIIKTLDMHVIIGLNGRDVKEKVRRLQQLRQPTGVGALQLIPGDIFENCIRGTPDQCVKKIQQFVDVGVTQFMLWFLDYPSMDSIRIFAENVLPQF